MGGFKGAARDLRENRKIYKIQMFLLIYTILLVVPVLANDFKLFLDSPDQCLSEWSSCGFHKLVDIFEQVKQMQITCNTFSNQKDSTKKLNASVIPSAMVFIKHLKSQANSHILKKCKKYAIAFEKLEMLDDLAKTCKTKSRRNQTNVKRNSSSPSPNQSSQKLVSIAREILGEEKRLENALKIIKKEVIELIREREERHAMIDSLNKPTIHKVATTPEPLKMSTVPQMNDNMMPTPAPTPLKMPTVPQIKDNIIPTSAIRVTQTKPPLPTPTSPLSQIKSELEKLGISSEFLENQSDQADKLDALTASDTTVPTWTKPELKETLARAEAAQLREQESQRIETLRNQIKQHNKEEAQQLKKQLEHLQDEVG